MIKTGTLLLILVLEVGYLRYTTSQEYPELDIEESFSFLEQHEQSIKVRILALIVKLACESPTITLT